MAAASAAQMRSSLAQVGIDLVILDVMLPDGDGLALCAALRQRPETANLPVIMLTAQGDPHSRLLGLELGADDYVSKPFEPREPVARIKAVLRRRSAPGTSAAATAASSSPAGASTASSASWCRRNRWWCRSPAPNTGC